MRCWRSLVWVALLSAGHVSAAAAQTLVLRNVGAAASVEVVYESEVVGKGAPDPAGTAQIPLTLPLAPGTTEHVLQFQVDRCQNLVRVGLADRDRLIPAAPPECERQELTGLYVIRRNTSVVIDLQTATPMLLVRQGPPPPQWLRGDYTGDMPAVVQPRAVTLSIGLTLPRLMKTFALACGDVRPCTATDFKPAVTFGGTYWFRNSLGAEVSLIKGATLEARGTEDPLTFTHRFETDILTLAGTTGGLFGTVRVYARGGLNYHRATSTVDQTLADRQQGDVLIKGESERFIVNTEGWGWMFGGGFEWYLRPPFGIFAEGAFHKVKGKAVGPGETVVNERVIAITAGGRLYLPSPFGRGGAPARPVPVPAAPDPAAAAPAAP